MQAATEKQIPCINLDLYLLLEDFFVKMRPLYLFLDKPNLELVAGSPVTSMYFLSFL